MSSDLIPHHNHVKKDSKERSPLQMMDGCGQLERLVRMLGLNTVQMSIEDSVVDKLVVQAV